MDDVARGFEAVGVAIIAIGCVVALVAGFKEFSNLDRYFSDVRRGFGRPLILGLESVGVLAILVAVRIALSFSLDVEVDGIAPWRRKQFGALVGRADEQVDD